MLPSLANPPWKNCYPGRRTFWSSASTRVGSVSRDPFTSNPRPAKRVAFLRHYQSQGLTCASTLEFGAPPDAIT